jgi:hypothetical protein
MPGLWWSWGGGGKVIDRNSVKALPFIFR